MSSQKISKSFLVFITLFFLSGCSSSRLNLTDENAKEAFRQSQFLVHTYGEIRDSEVSEYLSAITQRLMSTLPSELQVPSRYEILILNSEKPLALSPSVGLIALSRGLLESLRTEAQLAFVLAHEMSHQQLGHVSILRNLGNSPISDSERNQLEEKADKRAVGIVAFAGYDPYAAIEALSSTFHVFVREFPTNDEIPVQYEERFAALRDEIQRSGWTPPGTIDQRDFRKIKRLLRGIG